MNITSAITIIVVFLVLVVIVLALAFNSRRRSQKLQDHFGPEYDRTVQEKGNQKAAEMELEQRQRHVEALNIRPLTQVERDRYQADWTEVQRKFVDNPSQAIKDADRLIIEVMQLRDYPLANFEERAAEISVHYPAVVTNYRAAHEVAMKNEQNLADTEELRQAMVYYRSLFTELLKTEPAAVEMEKS